MRDSRNGRIETVTCGENGTWTWYHTSREGLKTFYWSPREGGIFHARRHLPLETVQDTGFCQFSLNGMSVSGAYKKIRRYFG